MGQDPQSEMLDILKDLQKRIGYLEKKIDLISEGSTARSSKPRNYAASRGSGGSQGSRSYAGDSRGSRSPGASPGARPSGGSSRYKDKHESAYGAKKEGAPKWYDKKKGADVPSAAKGKNRGPK